MWRSPRSYPASVNERGRGCPRPLLVRAPRRRGLRPWGSARGRPARAASSPGGGGSSPARPRPRRRACSAVHRPPGRESGRGRQVAPLAAGAHEVEQAVQHPPHVGRARPAVRRLGGRDDRGQQGVLLVAEGLPGTEIADQRPAGSPLSTWRASRKGCSPPEPPTRPLRPMPAWTARASQT